MAEQKPVSRRQGIQSVEIGLRVLAALAAQEGPAALGMVAKACGLSSSQTHRYLVSLVATGMAVQNQDSGRYDLGDGALRLGLAALSRTDPFNRANEAITAFVRDTGRTVLLAALAPTGPVIVRLAMGSPPVITSLMAGSPLPLLRSATGHVFLAFRPESVTREMARHELKAVRGLKAVDVKRIKQQVRAEGYASVSGSLIPGLRAAALPIFDMQGEALFVATLIANEAFEPDHDAALRAQLADVCRQISDAIGGHAPA